MDKQPPLLPWAEGLAPYNPIIKDGKLYGRGGADDGYAIFASLTSIMNLHQQNLPHARCLIMIEAGEESGSLDLPYYVSELAPKIKIPDLVVCLDSGCSDYEKMWMTTSLRGMIAGVLKIKILHEGVHSGHASGIVPSTFRILRQLLDRIENYNTGEILLPELHTYLPDDRKEQILHCAQSLNEKISGEFPWVEGAEPVTFDHVQQLINRTWMPTLSVVGVDGIPKLEESGNVLRPMTAVKLSIRIPPKIVASDAAQALKNVLEKDPPYGAYVTFDVDKAGSGWNCPPLSNWAQKSFETASLNYYQKPADYNGEGGSVPLIGMLAKLFPNSQFCVTGILGPESNAHGPNEMFSIEYAKRLTCCISQVIFDHYKSHE